MSKGEHRGEVVRVSQRREWNKVNPITVAKDRSEAHIAFLIADALGDIRDLQAAQAELVKALRNLVLDCEHQCKMRGPSLRAAQEVLARIEGGVE